MDIQLVFNELSLTPPAENVYVARQRMEDFVKTLNSAVQNGVSNKFRANAEFFNSALAPEYSIGNWVVDSEVNLDTRLFLQLLQTQYPFLTKEEENLLAAYKLANQTAEGLGAAYLLESLAVSLNSAPIWNFNSLTLIQETIVDDELNIIEEEVIVKHACSESHVLEHAEWIEHRVISGVDDGADLWDRRESLFPTLIFCEHIGKELESIDSGNPILRQIIKKLLEIEAQASIWEDGQFDIDVISADPESEATLQQYSQERTFECPDGELRLFSLHTRLAPGYWRMHFFPDPETHQVIIGYIGPHLQIVNSNT